MKKILFLNSSLHSGGIEKSLITLLSLFDYKTYEVDLQLFYDEGLFIEQIPPKVNRLPPLLPEEFSRQIGKAFPALLKQGKITLAFTRLLISFLNKKGTMAGNLKRIWKAQKFFIGGNPKKYDAVVAFMEGSPIYYAVEKTAADCKIGFIHGDYQAMKLDPRVDRPYFEKLDAICTVSPACLESLVEIFPEYAEKCHLIHNILAPALIRKRSQEKNCFSNVRDDVKIVTVARLSYQKGLDLGIRAMALLQEKGVPFQWYIIGIGPLADELRRQVAFSGLSEKVHFLGETVNPYPYIGQADFYFQPSRFEGKAIAVDEAMCLGKPVLATNFSTVRDQVRHEVNGLITGMNPAEISEGLYRMCTQPEFRIRCGENLKKQEFGNADEIEKLYRLFCRN